MKNFTLLWTQHYAKGHGNTCKSFLLANKILTYVVLPAPAACAGVAGRPCWRMGIRHTCRHK